MLGTFEMEAIVALFGIQVAHALIFFLLLLPVGLASMLHHLLKQLGKTSQRVCPWQAFAGVFNFCEQVQWPVL